MYPEWVREHREKGTAVSCIKGKYYLYAVSSKWNKEKGRAQKITNKYLGRITESGIIPPKTRSAKIEAGISVKEYGSSSVIDEMCKDIAERLAEKFGEYGEAIYTIAALRLIERCPFKRVEHYYENSYLSEKYPRLSLSASAITNLLTNIGSKRELLVEFMERYIGGSEHIIFDGTAITSNSEKMEINRSGYNAHRNYDPQVNLLYAFGIQSKEPAYYRIIPGNVRDVSAFSLTIAESGLKNAVVVADKGFASEDNFDMLNEAKLKYVIPLKRNSVQFDSDRLKSGSRADFDGYFMFNQRPIWYYTSDDIMVFSDGDLKAREEKQYLQKLEKKSDGFTMDGFLERQHKFGAIAIKTNAGKSPQETYNIYKERGEIEQSFDFLKNLLEQDKSYMQNEKSLEAWAFINHISLMINYRIYNLIREKNLLSKWSVSDFISHLKYIFKVKINGDWHVSEMNRKTSLLLDELGLHIT